MKRFVLEAHPSYWSATPEERAGVCNGCGPAGWKAALVPDSLLGLPIDDCCGAHDWDYDIGKTEADRKRADRRLLRNVRRKIACAGWRHWLGRQIGALIYYRAVRRFGETAFWEGKSKP